MVCRLITKFHITTDCLPVSSRERACCCFRFTILKHQNLIVCVTAFVSLQKNAYDSRSVLRMPSAGGSPEESLS